LANNFQLTSSAMAVWVEKYSGDKERVSANPLSIRSLRDRKSKEIRRFVPKKWLLFSCTELD
jgi:hypothetical protein